MTESEATPDGNAADELVPVVEAVLFAAGEPVHPREISGALEGSSEDAIRRAIGQLAERYAREGGGLLVEEVAGGYRIATRPDVGAHVRRFFRQRNRARLSQAALETLAVVAYRQPVTAPEIQAIRGVDPSAALRSLLDKKLLRILGRKKVVGNPLLYGTSKQFLVHFGLNRLSDLPSIEEFDAFVEAIDGRPDPLFPGEEGPVVDRIAQDDDGAEEEA